MGQGAVRPKLLQVPGGGPLLLLGGRLCKDLNLDGQQCMPSTGGAGSRDVDAESILLWVNACVQRKTLLSPNAFEFHC
jgi:hypothetical protein